MIGALRYGYIPQIFAPAGPMPSGIPNPEKARVRQLFAEGKVGRDELLKVEAASYHAPGTCTFYGTANSNQMWTYGDGRIDQSDDPYGGDCRGSRYPYQLG